MKSTSTSRQPSSASHTRRSRNHFHMDDLPTGKSANSSSSRFSDVLFLRRLRLNNNRTATASSLTTDSLSDSANQGGNQTQLRAMISNASTLGHVGQPGSSNLYRTMSMSSAKSGRSLRSNATTLTALSSLNPSSASRTGKSRRNSRFDEESSEGQLGINDKELNSMNKHIPALKSYGKSATFRQHYYPEGGWGWVIVTCAFIVNMFTYGIQLSYGLLQMEILKHCQDPYGQQEQRPQDDSDEVIVASAKGQKEMRMDAVWLGSTSVALSHILSPLIVAVCRRKSTRLMAVVGGLVMALAMLFTSFARFFHQIFVSYGILFGIGCAMVRETSTLMLSQYFKRRRETAELWSTPGVGIGVALFTLALHHSIGSLGWRIGLQSITAIVTGLFFLGLFYRSASLYHPQRRAILHLKDMSKRKGKDKNKAESKPAYFDFSCLKSRSLKVILASTVFCTCGAYSPLIFFVLMSTDEGLGKSAVTLQTYLGLAMALGSFIFGLLVLSKNKQCMISKQYLLQASMMGIAISILALTSVQGYYGYLLFVWMYGLFLGGLHQALTVFTFERMRVKHFPRAWGFIQGIKALPFLIGIIITGYINEGTGSPKAGFYFSFTMVLLGALCLFFIEGSKGSSYNHHQNQHAPMCKEASVMTSTGTHDDLALNDFPRFSTGGIGGPASAGPILVAPNIPMRCTCGDHSNDVIRSMPNHRRLSWSSSMNSSGIGSSSGTAGGVAGGILGVVMAAPPAAAVVMPSSDLIQEIDEELIELKRGIEEEDDDDDDDEDPEVDAPTVINRELLTCISEENLVFDNADIMIGDGFTANHPVDHENDKFSDHADSPSHLAKRKILYGHYGVGATEMKVSFSEPDLIRLLELCSPTPTASPIPFLAPKDITIPSSPVAQTKLSAPPSSLNRQKTWHHFKSALMPSSKKAKGKSKSSTNGTVEPTVITATASILATQKTSFV